MKEKHPLIQNTIILTFAGIIARFAGFYNRIFLSRTIGAKELGIYQMIFPIYLLCFSICCQGFQAGLSHFVASEQPLHHTGNIHYLVKFALRLCLFLSITLSVLLFIFADTISIHILNTPSAAFCLRIACFALPFVSIKACLQGYSVGCGNSSISATSQIVEQISRIGIIISIASTICYLLFPGARLAVIGMLFGEVISCILVLFLTKRIFPKRKNIETPSFSLKKDFLKISLPLCCNRTCLTLLQSIEAVLIPKQLMLFYCDHTLSLELYGTLTGIALPFLFFPSTITNSLSTMLMPSISADHSSHNDAHLNRSIRLATYGCFFMGLFFTGVFFLLGVPMGTYLFCSPTAGEYIRILSFLCPALYLSSINTSILNGMGQTSTTFLHNIFSIFVRLLFIFFAIPSFGIDGYLWGLLVSTFLLVLLNHIAIQKYIS